MSSRRLPLLVAVAAATLLSSLPAMAAEGPVVGMPPLPDQLEGWANTYLDPTFWADWVGDAIEDGHFNAAYPTDPVKPEAYLPNVPVADSDAYVSALPVEHADLSGFTYEYEGETKSIEQFLRTTRTDIVLLVKNGTVVGEWYENGYSADVRHQPWSVTKTYIAAVVGIAFDEGLIDSLQDPIDAYISELAGTQWEGVTIQNILQMESGVHWDEDTPVLAQNTQVEQWVDLALDLYTEGALGQTRNEFLASLPTMGYEQGTQMKYNSGNTQVLAWLTEELYGKQFNEILSEKLWIPMGADGDAIMTADREGRVVASHGLFARSHDFARFGEVLRNFGRTPEGVQVIPEDWVLAMTDMTDVSDGRYGYQTWAHRTAGPDAFSASGFQGQKITVVPSTCLTGVRMSYALGADIREGDDMFDPDSYGFSTEFYSEEWQTLLAAVGPELGDCDPAEPLGTTAANTTSAPPAPAPAPETTAGDLAATGGGLSALAVLALLGASTTRRRRD